VFQSAREDVRKAATWDAAPRTLREGARALRAGLGLAPEARVVGIVGRLAQMKGHAHFLRAARLIAQRVSPAAFLVIGEGPLAASLKEQVRALGLAELVRFLGYQAEIVTHLAACDVSVIASIYGEGFCSVGLESFLARTPVVMTKIAWVEGIYEHRRNALIVPPGDARAIAEAVVELLTHPELAETLVRNGEETVRACGIGPTADRYLACYEAALRTAQAGMRNGRDS